MRRFLFYNLKSQFLNFICQLYNYFLKPLLIFVSFLAIFRFYNLIAVFFWGKSSKSRNFEM